MKNISLRKLIENRLKQTKECEFKAQIINSLLGKDWACVRIKRFAKELTEEIKEWGD